MAKLLFTPVIHEGDAGCLASIEEFGIEVGAPSRAQALYGLRRLLETHCSVLPQRRDIPNTTEHMFALAEAVNRFGFEFMPDPAVLGPAIENVPHLEEMEGLAYGVLPQPGARVLKRTLIVRAHSAHGWVKRCHDLGGRCAFDQISVNTRMLT